MAIDPKTPVTLYLGQMRSAATHYGHFLDVYALAIDPQNPSTVYADAWYPSGLFKSVDGGPTWGQTTLMNHAIGSLAIAPEDPAVAYARLR